jgi:hypothetical protein
VAEVVEADAGETGSLHELLEGVREKLRMGGVAVGRQKTCRARTSGPAYLLAATTGLCRGEILGLRWADLDRYRLTVRQTTLASPRACPAKIMSEPLGHATVGFTLDIYTYRVEQLEHAAAHEFGRLIFGP